MEARCAFRLDACLERASLKLNTGRLLSRKQVHADTVDVVQGVHHPECVHKGFPGMSVYSATKAAVRSFARTWTNELRERRIRVNAISPGHIDTPIMESLQQGDALTAMKEGFTKAVPLGRMGDPDEIAKVVSFLASDEASYVSGVELFVDGGVAQI